MGKGNYLRVEQVSAVRQPGEVVASDDGNICGIAVAKNELRLNSTRNELYLFNPQHEKLRIHRFGRLNGRAFRISPDGKRIAFLASQKPNQPAQIYIAKSNKNAATRVTNLPLGAIDPHWLPNGKGLIFLSTVYRDARSLPQARTKKSALEHSPIKARATDRLWHKYWDYWFTDGEIPHLFHYDIQSKRIRDLTPDIEDFYIGGMGWRIFEGSFSISPDSREVAFSAAHFKDKPAEEIYTQLHTVSLTSRTRRSLPMRGRAHCFRPVYSPNGKHLLFGVTHHPNHNGDTVRVARVGRTLRSVRMLTKHWDRSPSSWRFSRDGSRILLLAEDRGHHGIFSLSPNGGLPQLLYRGGTLSMPVEIASRYYFSESRLGEPPELHCFHPKDGARRTISNFNSALSRVMLGRTEEVWFSGADSRRVQAFVVYPPHFSARRKWPLLQLVHGGPHNATIDGWLHRWNAHLFAAQGYVVSWVNFHGSSSFGDRFSRSICGAWGGKPRRDLLAFNKFMIRRGFIDRKRIGIAGGSYGGYLTSWMVASCREFQVAVAHAGVNDLTHIYGCDGVRPVGVALKKHYWQSHAAVDRYNPVRFSGKMVTPLLLTHGEQDFRVPVSNSMELFGLLKTKGVPARLVLFPDENHWILKPNNSQRWYREVIAWLEKYLS